MTCGVRIRSCTVKGSKPRRREPAGASMTRVRSSVTGGVRRPLCRLCRCRRACLVLARLSSSLALSMPPGASCGFFGRSFSRAMSSRSCRFSSRSAVTSTRSWTTSFFSSSTERASRSGSGGTDMPLDNHVDPLKESPYISSTQPPTGENDQVPLLLRHRRSRMFGRCHHPDLGIRQGAVQHAADAFGFLLVHDELVPATGPALRFPNDNEHAVVLR